MAKNYVDSGKTVTVPAPYDVASGDGCQVGEALFGVAAGAAVSGAPVVLDREGSFTLKKAAPLVINLGDRLFWDNTAKNLTKTATANLAVAICTVAAASADTTVTVVLQHTAANAA